MKHFNLPIKTYHSTETALIKVQNDILCAIDNKKSVILLSLDLSAAFDTVDHSVLLSRLTSSYGLRGTFLPWFRSYLASRKQYVRVEGCTSSFRSLDRGVPQGSVLGPSTLFDVHVAYCKDHYPVWPQVPSICR